MLTSSRKLELIKEFGKDEKNSGSSEVQIAIFSERINYLQGHLEKNKKDYSSQRGLMRLVNARKKMLAYLQEVNEQSYKDVIKRLGIRK